MLAPDRSPHINDSAPWTDADHERLTELYMMSPRPPIEQIAGILGRRVGAIQSQASRLSLASSAGPQAKMRKCMRACGRTFLSVNYGHRICGMCKSSAEFQNLLRCA
ncbi:hypothetical protein JQ580_33395 [Bradyrhizobium japonicum]|uniref:hypothetical protein n=1 Tax=Bradyrhizobium japonicum TaxID=375 RepID=UPI001BAA259F|nr:hypothetical protein [Bradyrhizobium japonicum]MBR0995611.1 hypothetical protein [Bradyrhizobium japonicum]